MKIAVMAMEKKVNFKICRELFWFTSSLITSLVKLNINTFLRFKEFK